MGVAAQLDVWGAKLGGPRAGGLRSCACSRTGWGRHHHHLRPIEFETNEYVEVTSSFDKMGLREGILRAIYVYGMLCCGLIYLQQLV